MRLPMAGRTRRNEHDQVAKEMIFFMTTTVLVFVAGCFVGWWLHGCYEPNVERRRQRVALEMQREVARQRRWQDSMGLQ